MREGIAYTISYVIVGVILGLLIGSTINFVQVIPQYEVDEAMKACEGDGGVHTYKVAMDQLQMCTCKNGKIIYGDDYK